MTGGDRKKKPAPSGYPVIVPMLRSVSDALCRTRRSDIGIARLGLFVNRIEVQRPDDAGGAVGRAEFGHDLAVMPEQQAVFSINNDLPVGYPVNRHWTPFIAMDWGSSAPSVAFACLRAPGDVGGYPRGSLILLDELATVQPNDPNAGLGWPPGKLAEAIREMCGRWGIPAQGVGDDAAGLDDTLLNVLREHRVYLVRPRKERVAGWAAMRELLHCAKERNGRAGMWITARCRYFWATVPFLERDPRRPEDIVTDGPDHAADAARYAVMHLSNRARSGRTHGLV